MMTSLVRTLTHSHRHLTRHIFYFPLSIHLVSPFTVSWSSLLNPSFSFTLPHLRSFTSFFICDFSSSRFVPVWSSFPFFSNTPLHYSPQDTQLGAGSTVTATMADGGKKASKAFGNAWRGAAAYHYYMLAQRQYYSGFSLSVCTSHVITFLSYASEGHTYYFLRRRFWLVFSSYITVSITLSFLHLICIMFKYRILFWFNILLPSSLNDVIRSCGCIYEDLYQTVRIWWHSRTTRYLFTLMPHIHTE